MNFVKRKEKISFAFKQKFGHMTLKKWNAIIFKDKLRTESDLEIVFGNQISNILIDLYLLDDLKRIIKVSLISIETFVTGKGVDNV